MNDQGMYSTGDRDAAFSSFILSWFDSSIKPKVKLVRNSDILEVPQNISKCRAPQPVTWDS